MKPDKEHKLRFRSGHSIVYWVFRFLQNCSKDDLLQGTKVNICDVYNEVNQSRNNTYLLENILVYGNTPTHVQGWGPSKKWRQDV